jgi:tRNA modification GTPase
MTIDLEATICGIATGQVPAPRGAVRLSGPRTLTVLNAIHPLPVGLREASRARRMSVAWNLGHAWGLLPVDIWYWPNHRSYTGMPSAELHTVGQPCILQALVEQLCQHGASLARPGEFTLRAFLAGRLDLTQCEAVLGVIEAQSEAALQVSLRQLAGGLATPLSQLRRSLIDLLADIEAGLDFVDEDIEFVSRTTIAERLEGARTQVSGLLRQIQTRHAAASLPRVVLTGLPNAGKSSLVNALTGTRQALVHEQAGTTRDFLRLPLPLKHGKVELIDTAGIEECLPSTPSERLAEIAEAAQSHRCQQLEQADLILLCIDHRTSDAEAKVQGERLLGELSRSRPSSLPERWLLWTQCDDARPRISTVPLAGVTQQLSTSSHRPWGIESLQGQLDAWLERRLEELTAVAPLTATRCRTLLQAAEESLQAALTATTRPFGDELIAGEIRLCLEQLGQVAGDTCNEDILDALFSRFCIGK